MDLAFRGRPSKGCNKCRARKIRCDEAQPQCERCVKGGFDCVYRDEFDLMLRNQTNETAVKAQKKWRSRAKKAEVVTATTTTLSSATSATSPSGSSEAGSPRELLEVRDGLQVLGMEKTVYELAMRRFEFDFVIAMNQQVPRSGFAAFVPDLEHSSEPDTCAWHALRATSLANFACRSKSELAASLAPKEYNLCIKYLQQYIAQPGSTPPVQVLASISLLSLYELLSTPVLTRHGSWQAHVNGAAAILNDIYAQSGTDLEEITELFNHIMTQMLIQRLSFGKWPSIPMSTVEAFIRPKTMSHQVLQLMYNATEVVAEWHQASTEAGTDTLSLVPAARRAVERADAVDAEILQWLSERAPIWEEETKVNKPENVPTWLEDLYSLPGAPTRLRSSNNLLIAHRVNLLRGTRIQMHSHALNAIDILIASASTVPDLTHWLEVQPRFETRFLSISNDMLSALYGLFVLPIRGKPTPRDVDEVPTLRIFMVLWPVNRACVTITRRESLRGMDAERRRLWARALLCWMRDEIGFKKCVALVQNIDGEFGMAYT